MLPFNYTCKSLACNFDKSITASIFLFEIIIILGVVLSIFLFSKIKNKAIYHFAILAIGVFIFEFFTNPLWLNYHLGRLAYVYQDVSWVLTLGWSAIILFGIFLTEKYFSNYTELRKFVVTLTFVTILGLLGETAVVNLGIRNYSSEVQQIINGAYLPLLNIPLAALYYIPVFMALVISFYKFWSVFLEKGAVAPFKNAHWTRKLSISLVGILLFEVMVDPMVINANLPKWSYIYRDISILATGTWILLIWLAVIIIDKVFPYVNVALKFFGYIILATIMALPIEAISFANNIREYAPSTMVNFSGYSIPLLNLPIEIVFAIAFNLILVMAFMHYWTYYSNRIIKNK